jgi:hypothetical protein
MYIDKLLNALLQEFDSYADAESPRQPLAFASNQWHSKVDLDSYRL